MAKNSKKNNLNCGRMNADAMDMANNANSMKNNGMENYNAMTDDCGGGCSHNKKSNR